MSIVKRTRTTNPFEPIPRKTLQDQRLDIDSLGALCRLLSLPGDWVWHLTQIESYLGIGRDRRRRVFSELKEFGYLKQTRKITHHGRFEYEYDLVDETDMVSTEDVKPVSGETVSGETATGGTDSGKAVDLEKTDSQMTNEQITQPPLPQKSSGGVKMSKYLTNEDKEIIVQRFGSNVNLQSVMDEFSAACAGGRKINSPVLWFESVLRNYVPTGAGLRAAKEREGVSHA